MTKAELFDLISHFAQRPVPALNGRHVYLWHGSEQALRQAIPSEVFIAVDLHGLVTTLSRTPRARDEAGRLLRQAIQAQVNAWLAHRQQVFVITGCDLLSRYQVPLNLFFQLASEQTMFILVISPAETHFQPTQPLPGYVLLEAAAPFNYVQAAVGTAATISMDEDAP